MRKRNKLIEYLLYRALETLFEWKYYTTRNKMQMHEK